MKRLVVALLLAIAAPASAGHLPPYPDGTNGCSVGISRFWRKITHKIPPWEYCCYAHDRAYRRPGIWSDRSRADQAMLACVAKHDAFAGAVMYGVVVPFGQVVYQFDWSRIKEDHAAQQTYARAAAE